MAINRPRRTWVSKVRGLEVDPNMGDEVTIFYDSDTDVLKEVKAAYGKIDESVRLTGWSNGDSGRLEQEVSGESSWAISLTTETVRTMPCTTQKTYPSTTLTRLPCGIQALTVTVEKYPGRSNHTVPDPVNALLATYLSQE